MLYGSKLYEEEILSASRIYVKFSLIKLLVGKTFSPRIAIYDLKRGGIRANGYLGAEIKTGVKITSPEEALEAIKSIRLYNLSAKGPFLNVENVNGSVSISPGSIKSSPIDFALNGVMCKLSFEVTEPLGELSSEFSMSSPEINVTSVIKKENGVHKISKMEGRAFNSSFAFTGEISGVRGGAEDPVLSLYGRADINVKDIARLAGADLKKSIERLNPEGLLANDVYFKINMKNPEAWELGIKSGAESLKAGNIRLANLRMNTRIKDGLAEVPLLNAYLYNGVLVSSAAFDLRDKTLPYRLTCKLNNMDIKAVLADIGLKAEDVKGLLSSEFTIQGKAGDINTMEGPGRIIVTNANLGPMPLLTPLLGHIYGYFRHAFPELQKVNIRAGSADFYIRNRRLTTDNLTLSGDMIGIYARGYVDFDKNLDFEVENKILSEASGGDDWQAGLQQIIMQFGKMISKARLTGTLENPKWKFEYLGGVQNIFKGGLEKLFKDILE
jgi:hypothetical protein